MLRRRDGEMVREPKENTGLSLLSATEEFNLRYLPEYARHIYAYK